MSSGPVAKGVELKGAGRGGREAGEGEGLERGREWRGEGGRRGGGSGEGKGVESGREWRGGGRQERRGVGKEVGNMERRSRRGKIGKCVME